MKCSMTGQEKKGLFNTGDCLIEVMKYARLTVTLSKIVRSNCPNNMIISKHFAKLRGIPI
jgi:hypothetical protein